MEIIQAELRYLVIDCGNVIAGFVAASDAREFINQLGAPQMKLVDSKNVSQKWLESFRADSKHRTVAA